MIFLKLIYCIKKSAGLLIKRIFEMIKTWIKKENENGNPLANFLYRKLKKYASGYAGYLQDKNEYKKIKQAFGQALNTPSFRCNTNAPTEIHSLVPHKHLYMYILSIKSFLRFYDNVAVIVHDDGTLKRADAKILREHIGGIEIIGNTEADKKVNDILKAYPSCCKFRNSRINQRQVFDFSILAKRNKLIILDSDALFFKSPEKIGRWIESGNREILYIYRENPTGPIIEGEFITNMCNIGKTPFKFAMHLNCGLVCYYGDMIDLELIEEYCAYILKNCKNESETFFAQPIIALCAGNSKYAPSILPEGYQNPPYFIQEPVFRHYWSAYPVTADYIMDAKKVAAQLKF